MPEASNNLIVELIVILRERSIAYAVGGKGKFAWWRGLRCAARHLLRLRRAEGGTMRGTEER